MVDTDGNPTSLDFTDWAPVFFMNATVLTVLAAGKHCCKDIYYPVAILDYLGFLLFLMYGLWSLKGEQT